ncbi:hypothetical protein L873DRAFT_1847768 [Choiromyces venosus 120613-1]|uniref:Uncharacterized protein n=1 Tax=Choiromyces venosus 120613-1 TaxID=1336337 RepID=A0A3N4J5L8_9PEZI|nr:hypothetical protein L873DRAFT_1847768 [Choiromyces venosus 120613-1]
MTEELISYYTIAAKIFTILKMLACLKMLGKWIKDNQTLTADFRGTDLLITNEQSGHSDIKGNTKDDFYSGKFSTIDSKFAANDTNITCIYTKREVMTGPILKSAVATMKGPEGNKTELKEFVKRADKVFKYVDLDEGCEDNSDRKL